MKTLLASFVIAAALLLAGCELMPPQVQSQPLLNARLFVTSSVPGALISLDGVSQNRFTPDTVYTTPGNHTITLSKDGYLPASVSVTAISDSTVSVNSDLLPTVQRVVVLEDFANVSCVPCVTSNLIINSIKSYTFNSTKLAVIKVPANFPGPNDPMYLAAKTYCDSRLSYYNIVFAPTTIIDGIIRPVSSDSIKVKAAIEQRLSIPPKFSLSIKDSVAGSMLYYSVTLKCLDSSDISAANLALRFSVIEEEITYTTPPGSNGETVFHDVLREMLPDQNCTTITTGGIVPGYQQTVNLSTSIKSQWQLSKIKGIAFIQNRLTREIYQAAVTQ